MKKLIILIIFLATVIINFVNIQNLNNKKINNVINSDFQLQLIIRNYTNNVGWGATKCENLTYFYLDISINGNTYTTKNFNSNIEKGPYQDVFKTPNNATTSIYTMNINNYDILAITFTFGTLYNPIGIWFHAQLTSANDYRCNFRNENFKYKNNGTKLIISAYDGGDGVNNNANWNLQYYKF